MPEMQAVSVKTDQFVGLDRVAQEPHARLVVADAANDGAELAGDHPCRQQIAQAQGQCRGPEEPERDDGLRCLDAGQVLQAGQAVVAAQAAVVLEQIERQASVIAWVRIDR